MSLTPASAAPEVRAHALIAERLPLLDDDAQADLTAVVVRAVHDTDFKAPKQTRLSRVLHWFGLVAVPGDPLWQHLEACADYAAWLFEAEEWNLVEELNRRFALASDGAREAVAAAMTQAAYGEQLVSRPKQLVGRWLRELESASAHVGVEAALRDWTAAGKADGEDVRPELPARQARHLDAWFAGRVNDGAHPDLSAALRKAKTSLEAVRPRDADGLLALDYPRAGQFPDKAIRSQLRWMFGPMAACIALSLISGIWVLAHDSVWPFNKVTFGTVYVIGRVWAGAVGYLVITVLLAFLAGRLFRRGIESRSLVLWLPLLALGLGLMWVAVEAGQFAADYLIVRQEIAVGSEAWLVIRPLMYLVSVAGVATSMISALIIGMRQGNLARQLAVSIRADMREAVHRNQEQLERVRAESAIAAEMLDRAEHIRPEEKAAFALQCRRLQAMVQAAV